MDSSKSLHPHAHSETTGKWRRIPRKFSKENADDENLQMMTTGHTVASVHSHAVKHIQASEVLVPSLLPNLTPERKLSYKTVVDEALKEIREAIERAQRIADRNFKMIETVQALEATSSAAPLKKKMLCLKDLARN
jgi:hypothetical protein